MCRFTLWGEQVSTPLSHWTRGSWSWMGFGAAIQGALPRLETHPQWAPGRPLCPPRLLPTYVGRKVLQPPNGRPPFSTPPPPPHPASSICQAPPCPGPTKPMQLRAHPTARSALGDPRPEPRPHQGQRLSRGPHLPLVGLAGCWGASGRNRGEL